MGVRCENLFRRDRSFRTLLTSIARYSRCKGHYAVRAFVDFDLTEAARQAAQLKGLAVSKPEDVQRVTAYVRARRDSSSNVIFVAHSQGNMFVAQALQSLVAEGFALQDGTCVAALSLAAPNHRQDFPLDNAHIRGLRIQGDILEVLKLPSANGNGFDVANTTQSFEYRARIQRSRGSAEYELRVKYGLDLHYAGRNYFLHPETSLVVAEHLIALDTRCAQPH